MHVHQQSRQILAVTYIGKIVRQMHGHGHGQVRTYAVITEKSSSQQAIFLRQPRPPPDESGMRG
jgi:hypothetical protein